MLQTMDNLHKLSGNGKGFSLEMYARSCPCSHRRKAYGENSVLPKTNVQQGGAEDAEPGPITKTYELGSDS